MIHQLGQEGHKKISNKLPIIGIVAIVLIVLGLIFMSNAKYKYRTSTEEMLTEVLKRNDVIRPAKLMDILYTKDSLYRFIDLRSAPEFLESHIEGAIHIPLSKVLNDEYKHIFNQDEKINILYNSNQSGACSPWMVLKQLGYKNNKVLQGGYNYVKENIIENFSPMSGNYRDEKAKYDFAKVIKNTAGANSGSVESSNDDASVPVVTPHGGGKEEEEGGC